MPQKLSERLAKYVGPIQPNVRESLQNIDRIQGGESVQSVYIPDRPGPVNAEYYQEAIQTRLERDLRTVALAFLECRYNAEPNPIDFKIFLVPKG